jgi:HK97 family phage major capsid protein
MAMSEELTKELEALKASLGKNVDALARVDKLEEQLKVTQAGVAEVKAVRAELDKIQLLVAEREATIRKWQEEARVVAVRRDPIQDKIEARRTLGMIVRAEMARYMRTEMPAEFKTEGELIRKYNEQCLQRATLTPMSTTGSYVVPTVTEGSIMDAVEEVDETLSLIDFRGGLPAGGTYNFTFLASRPVMQKKRAGTDTAMTASDPVFSQLQLSPNETYIYFPVDNKLFRMSAVALGGYFEGLCRDGMVDKLGYWLLRADASASYNTLTGILNEATAAYLYSLGAGKTAFADLADTDLQKIKAKCLKRGRGPKGRWLMDLEIQGIIESMDRTGKLPVIREREDGTMVVKQNPVVIGEHMPGLDESAPSTAFAVYGDLATMMMVQVGGMEVMSDASRHFDTDQTAFRAKTIMAFGRKPVATLITVKTAAA